MIDRTAARHPDAFELIRGEADKVREAPPGARNDALRRAAFDLAREPGVDEHVARSYLVLAARDAGLGFDEIHPTIRRGWDEGLASLHQAVS